MTKVIPLKYPRISQEYGRKSASYNKGYHTGIDLVAGGTDKGVYNTVAGTVVRARFFPGAKGADAQGWGNYVIIRQEDGHDVLYAHLAQIAVVQGQKVSPGDKVGLQGSTGNATGSHLHFEVWAGSWENRNDINSADYLGIKNAVGPVEYVKEDMVEEVKVVEKGVFYGAIRYNGKTYVELRAYASQDGKKVDWDEATKTATVTGGKLEEIKVILQKLQK